MFHDRKLVPSPSNCSEEEVVTITKPLWRSKSTSASFVNTGLTNLTSSSISLLVGTVILAWFQKVCMFREVTESYALLTKYTFSFAFTSISFSNRLHPRKCCTFLFFCNLTCNNELWQPYMDANATLYLGWMAKLRYLNLLYIRYGRWHDKVVSKFFL